MFCPHVISVCTLVLPSSFSEMRCERVMQSSVQLQSGTMSCGQLWCMVKCSCNCTQCKTECSTVILLAWHMQCSSANKAQYCIAHVRPAFEPCHKGTHKQPAAFNRGAHIHSLSNMRCMRVSDPRHAVSDRLIYIVIQGNA